MSLPGIGGSYEGKLDAAAGTITGTFTQGDKPLPLNLTRASGQAVWPIPQPPVQIKPMAADASPAFEVATIKPSNPETPGKAVQVKGRNFSTLNTTLSELIAFAYGVHAKQIINGRRGRNRKVRSQRPARY
jgi:hypothetical protein